MPGCVFGRTAAATRLVSQSTMSATMALPTAPRPASVSRFLACMLPCLLPMYVSSISTGSRTTCVWRSFHVSPNRCIECHAVFWLHATSPTVFIDERALSPVAIRNYARYQSRSGRLEMYISESVLTERSDPLHDLRGPGSGAGLLGSER